MSYVIAKRSDNTDSLDYHLWREGAKVVRFETQFDAIAYFSELVLRFGSDNLLLLKEISVSVDVQVEQ